MSRPWVWAEARKITRNSAKGTMVQIARDQKDDLANLAKLLMDLEEQSNMSNRSKVWTTKDKNLRAGSKKNKQQYKSCSIY